MVGFICKSVTKNIEIMAALTFIPRLTVVYSWGFVLTVTKGGL